MSPPHIGGEDVTNTQNFFIDGEAYERLMGRFTRAAGEVFIDWLSAPKGLDWVDVGCGTGAFTQLLLDRCAPKRVSAIDPSAEQIAYARKTPAAERVDFKIGDAQSLPFDDATFEAGVMALVITFVPDPNKAVAELRRVTKPGGMVATYMWDIFNKGLPQNPLREALERRGIEVPYLPGHAHSLMDNMANTSSPPDLRPSRHASSKSMLFMRISTSIGVGKLRCPITSSNISARCRQPT